ncbi:MAG TPA: LL-diaminopimelate aminotransferase [Phycisphaerae bacterium]|nr:LL-diaminopimelate aminotransferase [Phycisphaerae bacterium]
MMAWEKSDRLKALPPYVFAEIDRAKRAAIAAGREVTNFGVGDPDRPTFGFIVEAMRKAVGDPANHRYPFDEGVPQFRAACAKFMAERYGVTLDPATEIITSIGSKEAIAHMPLAVVNPGEAVLVPRPGYPVYNSAAVFAGGEPVYMLLTAENDWLPDLDAIDDATAEKAKLIYVNYPNNPTGAVADLRWYEKLVDWARRHRVIIANDAAYNETYYDDPPPSIFEVDGARELAVEFHSLSKTFNMTGWRLGWVAGNAELVGALAAVKGNCDSGQFNAVQWAGIAALEGIAREEVLAQRRMYRRRRDALCEGLAGLGYEVTPPPATFYVWAKCPAGVGSMDFAKRCLAEASVVFIPGIGFGDPGEGYFRAALTVEAERIAQAIERLGKLSW